MVACPPFSLQKMVKGKMVLKARIHVKSVTTLTTNYNPVVLRDGPHRVSNKGTQYEYWNSRIT